MEPLMTDQNATPLAIEGPLVPEIYATAALGAEVEREFLDWKNKRADYKEKVWTRCMNNYNGSYDRITQANLTANNQSDVYVKVTRMMVGMAMSRLVSIMLPSVGRPWTMDPTPLPELPIDLPPDQSLQDHIVDIMVMAKEAAYRMSRQIDDRLVEMRYGAKLMDALLDLTLYGTMVWRGPLKTDRPTTQWGIQEETDPNTGQTVKAFKKSVRSNIQPDFDHISIWKVYPDPYASNVDECTGMIIRHVLTQTQLRRLARDPSFNSDEINRVLVNRPTGNWYPEPWEDDRSLSNDESSFKYNRYVVLEAWRMCSGQILRDIGLDVADDDLLTEKMYQVWVCDGAVLKAEPADYFQAPPFIFCPYEVIDGSIWGRGVAEQMEDSQSVICSLIRGLIDNFAFGIGPMIEVEGFRMDGVDYGKIAPRQVFVTRRTDADSGRPAVQVHTIPVLADVILPVVKYFVELIQFQTSLPFNLQGMGDMGSGVRTIGQQTMTMQASEAFIRLVVNTVDKKFIEPMLNALYDWEMHFNPDPTIKGDFRIKAMGVAGAMAKEVATQRKLELFQMISQNANIADRAKIEKWIDSFVKGFDLQDEGLMYSDEEYAQIQQQRAQAEAQKEQMMQTARRYKAESTDKDALVTLATRITADKALWGPAMAEAFKAIGVENPQLYAALSADMQVLADNLVTTGALKGGEDYQRLSEDVKPPQDTGGKPSPIEIEARTDNQAFDPYAGMIGIQQGGTV